MKLTPDYQAAKDQLASMTKGATYLIVGLAVALRQESFGHSCSDVCVDSISVSEVNLQL